MKFFRYTGAVAGQKVGFGLVDPGAVYAVPEKDALPLEQDPDFETATEADYSAFTGIPVEEPAAEKPAAPAVPATPAARPPTPTDKPAAAGATTDTDTEMKE